MTRCDNDFRSEMYKIIHFTTQDEEFELPLSVKEYSITNPDVERHNSFATFLIDGKPVECFTAYVTTRHFENEGERFFDYGTTALVPVDGTDKYYIPDEAENYYEIFGSNTGYVIDPEECMADNFACLIANGMNGPDGNGYPNPEIITSIEHKLKDQSIPVRVLILSKFELDDLEGDLPGEAQLFYEEYLAGGDEYEIDRYPEPDKLYYKDGVAMFLTGEGKVSAALGTSAVLSDKRFDFSDAYILSTGCGGSAEGYGIPGDVFVISAAVDYDLGHHADVREMSNMEDSTWFHDETYDGSAVIYLDQSLTDRAFDLVKDVQLETTEQTVKYLNKEYPGESWADRQPQVMRGTSVSGDNYWKGRYDHQNALLIMETYHCEDPYAITEMEDIAVGQAVKRFGMLDRLIILRVGVNMDVFVTGVTPEMLWGTKSVDSFASENSIEYIDVFQTGMHNCYVTGKVLIDAILEGHFWQ